MAYFQVEIARTSPLPFQNNLNNLDINDLWVHQPQWKAGSGNGNGNGNGSSKGNNALTETEHKDKWARAREIVFPAATTTTTTDVSNPGGVSSLVQKWRGFEAAGAKKPPPPPPPPGHITDDDSSLIGDWESDRTGRDSDATERERLRVVDIIRKLTPNDCGSVSPPRLRTSLDHSDLRGLPPPVPGSRVRTSWDCDLRCLSSSSTRVRGRQAYLDLLLQLERERREELLRLGDRKPVSTFSHRGRIQATLKIKLLRRGMEAGHHSNTIQTYVSRERVVNPKPQSQNDGMHWERCGKDNSCANSNLNHQNIIENTEEEKDQLDCITSKQEDSHGGNNNDFLHRYEETSNAQETNCQTSDPPESFYCNEIKEGEEFSYDPMHDSTMLESGANWVTEQGCEEGWEEFDYTDDQTNNRDWIYEVSRPRSDWEYLRQERYQEMLNPFLENEDIRTLLGRKNVSNFLSSGMRDKIDQLLISRSQGPQNMNNNRIQEKRQAKLVAKKLQEKEKEEDEEYVEYYDEFEEADSSQQYTECDEFTDPSVASSSWSQNQNQAAHESSEFSYQAVSPSTQQSSANYCSQDINGRNSSFNSQPSMEMDQIYDLRRHMELLHQEISQMRKAIQMSTDMQIKQHRSIKKQVAAALNHTDVKSGRRKRMCRMCCKEQIDCVLYKCGHMCTCFDCAHELMWNSGSCPVCTVQIVDVIRTISND